MVAIALLIHLNGAPGVGKSSVARRYLDDHPLALLLEIDEIRTRLGQWGDQEESKVLARDLALAMADAHLRLGHDVVVPQHLGRTDFVRRLEEVAERCDAGFIEVVLEADRAVTTQRFRSRRQDLLARGEPHPESDVDDRAVEAAVTDAIALLEDVKRTRPGTVTVAAGGSNEQTYLALLVAIDAAAPQDGDG